MSAWTNKVMHLRNYLSASWTTAHKMCGINKMGNSVNCYVVPTQLYVFPDWIISQNNDTHLSLTSYSMSRMASSVHTVTVPLENMSSNLTVQINRMTVMRPKGFRKECCDVWVFCLLIAAILADVGHWKKKSKSGQCSVAWVEPAAIMAEWEPAITCQSNCPETIHTSNLFFKL